MPRREANQDEEFDVVVVGSGGAGLTAAILAHDHGARVAVLERSDKIGGTTAVSGGGVWIPRSDHMAEVGMTDSRDEALAYCKALVAGQAGDDLVEAFVDTAHKMVRYLEAHTPLKFTPWTIPDYHPNVAGAKLCGRSIEPAIFDKRALGSWENALRQSPFYFIPLTLQEVLFTYQGHVRPQNLPPDVILERMERGLTTCGNALVAALLKACLDRDVAFRLETRARELVLEDGCVTGVRAEVASGDLLVRARKGVVLASGGFEWNDALKARYLPGPVSHPSSPPQNEGDGLLMAIEAGAALGNMSEVWGSPAASIPGESYDGRDLHRLVVPERACPHAILVNQRGERFVNEGTAYNELGKVFHERDSNTGAYCNLPCWAILDGQYRSRYPILTVLPSDPDPEWLPKAAVVAAVCLGITAIQITGERMAFLLSLIGLAVAGLLAPGTKRFLLVTLVIAGVAVAGLFAANKTVFERTYQSTIADIGGFTESHYGQIWLSTLRIAAQNPAIGIGLKNFRTACQDPAYGQTENLAARCDLHPHNMYLEWLSEAGVIGFAGFLALITLWTRHFVASAGRWRHDPVAVGPVISVIVFLWPIASTQSFFSNWNAGLFWFVLGWALAVTAKGARQRTSAAASP